MDMHLSHVPQAHRCSASSARSTWPSSRPPRSRATAACSSRPRSGLSPTLLHSAKKIIIEVNRRHSPRLREMTDIALLPPPPHRLPIPILDPLAKIGVPVRAGRSAQDHRHRRALGARRRAARSRAPDAGEPAHRRPGGALPAARAARRAHPARSSCRCRRASATSPTPSWRGSARTRTSPTS